MNLFLNMHHALKARYLALSLRSKISFALIAIVSTICGLVMLASYASMDYFVRNYTDELLNSNAKLEQRELEIQLSAEIQSATDFAGNFITANALVGTHESELYLLPYLNNQHHAFANTGLTIVDYRGRPIASNLKQKPDYESNAALKAMMDTGKPQIQLQKHVNQEAVLITVLPVYGRQTKVVEGGGVLEIPLQSILRPSTSNNFHWLVDDKEIVLAGEKPDFSQVIVSAGHQLQLPIDGVDLKIFSCPRP